MPGYSAASAEAERRVEAAAIAVPSPESAGVYARALSREPHMSGTPTQARTRDYVIEQMRAMGLETSVRTYEGACRTRRAYGCGEVAGRRSCRSPEGPVPGDSTSALPEVPPVNGYSGSGDVTGEVVYVNYGLIEDYAQLDSLGVSVRGKIAVARYGRSFRGIKAREAERHGAVGAADLQRSAGRRLRARRRVSRGPDAQPERRAARQRVQRRGDPATPGYASTSGRSANRARRRWASRTFPSCRSRTATRASCSHGVRGAAMPQAWQGGLPFRYHVGPGPVRARVAVATTVRRRAPSRSTTRSDRPRERVPRRAGDHRRASRRRGARARRTT